MSPHAATFSEALDAFQSFTAWWGGFIPVRLGEWKACWRQGPASNLPDFVRRLDEWYSDEIELGMPQDRPFNGGVSRASVLWCKVEGKDQLARARRHRPLPSLVVQEGSSSRRWLFWPLERTIDYFQLKAANRKLAYAFGATQKFGDPDVAWVPAPGTCLRRGRSRPVPVVVSRLTVDVFEVDAVVGRLREPPELANWWETASR